MFRSIELNQNTVCVYELSIGCNSGMSKYINLELSGNDEGNGQLIEELLIFVFYE